MTARTSAYTEGTSCLHFQPHRLQSTAPLIPHHADLSAQWVLGPSDLQQLQKTALQAIAAWQAAHEAGRAAELALMYQEFAPEDHVLAEAGLHEFGRFLDDADGA